MKFATFVFMGGFLMLYVLWLFAPKMKKQMVENLGLILKSAGWGGIGLMTWAFLIYGIDSVRLAKFTLLSFLASVMILGMGHAFAEEAESLKEKILKCLSRLHWAELREIGNYFTDPYGKRYSDKEITDALNQLQAEERIFFFNSFVESRG
jgi:hypothetical protein